MPGCCPLFAPEEPPSPQLRRATNVDEHGLPIELAPPTSAEMQPAGSALAQQDAAAAAAQEWCLNQLGGDLPAPAAPKRAPAPLELQREAPKPAAAPEAAPAADEMDEKTALELEEDIDDEVRRLRRLPTAELPGCMGPTADLAMMLAAAELVHTRASADVEGGEARTLLQAGVLPLMMRALERNDVRPNAEAVHRLTHAVRGLLLVPSLAADPTLDAQGSRHGKRLATALIGAMVRHERHEGVVHSCCAALGGLAGCHPPSLASEPRHIASVVDAMRLHAASAEVQAAAAGVVVAVLRRRLPSATPSAHERTEHGAATIAAAHACMAAGAVSRLAKALKAHPNDERAALGSLRALRLLLDAAALPFRVSASPPTASGGGAGGGSGGGGGDSGDPANLEVGFEAEAEPGATEAPPQLREKAARMAQRANVVEVCRALLLTHYGATAQESLLTLAACVRCENVDGSGGGGGGGSGGRGGHHAPELSQACEAALPTACKAAQAAAVERGAACAVAEMVALLPAGAPPPPAAAQALVRAAQSASATDGGLQLRVCAAARSLARRHAASRKTSPRSSPTEALLMHVLRAAQPADDEGGGGGGGGGGRTRNKQQQLLQLQRSVPPSQLQIVALQAIEQWLRHGLSAADATPIAEALVAAGLGRALRHCLEVSYAVVSGATAPRGAHGGTADAPTEREARALLAASLDLAAQLFRCGGGGRDVVAAMATVRSAALSHILQRPTLQKDAAVQCATVNCLAAQLSRGEARRALTSSETVPAVLGALRRHAYHAELAAHACSAIATIAASSSLQPSLEGTTALPLVVTALRRHAAHAELVHAACWALRGLCCVAEGARAAPSAGTVAEQSRQARLKELRRAGGVPLLQSALEAHAGADTRVRALCRELLAALAASGAAGTDVDDVALRPAADAARRDAADVAGGGGGGSGGDSRGARPQQAQQRQQRPVAARGYGAVAGRREAVTYDEARDEADAIGEGIGLEPMRVDYAHLASLSSM